MSAYVKRIANTTQHIQNLCDYPYLPKVNKLKSFEVKHRSQRMEKTTNWTNKVISIEHDEEYIW